MWRVGRKVGRTIYYQTGTEPSDDDELVGVMDTPQLAALVVQAVNAADNIEAAMRDSAWDIVENGIVPEYTATAQLLLPAAPVEWAGEFHDGRWWYFRARHEYIIFGVGDTLKDAVCNAVRDLPEHKVMGGKFAASHLSPEQTLAWLRRLLKEMS
jgi:hypothetical protein